MLRLLNIFRKTKVATLRRQLADGTYPEARNMAVAAPRLEAIIEEQLRQEDVRKRLAARVWRQCRELEARRQADDRRRAMRLWCDDADDLNEHDAGGVA